MAKTTHRTAPTPQTTPRHLWLAALGLATVTRRETLVRVERARSGFDRLPRQLVDSADAVRADLQARLDALRAQSLELIATVRDGIESRLAPLLAVKPAASKPAARKSRKAPGNRRPTGSRRSARAAAQARGTRRR